MYDKEYQEKVEIARIAEDIKRLRSLPEFRALDRLLKNIYRNAVEKIISEESQQDRVKIRFIDELFDAMDYDLKLGEDASKWLEEQKLNQTPDSDTE